MHSRWNTQQVYYVPIIGKANPPNIVGFAYGAGSSISPIEYQLVNCVPSMSQLAFVNLINRRILWAEFSVYFRSPDIWLDLWSSYNKSIQTFVEVKEHRRFNYSWIFGIPLLECCYIFWNIFWNRKHFSSYKPK